MIQTLLTFFVSLNTPRMDKLENQQGQLLYEKKKLNICRRRFHNSRIGLEHLFFLIIIFLLLQDTFFPVSLPEMTLRIIT